MPKSKNNESIDGPRSEQRGPLLIHEFYSRMNAMCCGWTTTDDFTPLQETQTRIIWACVIAAVVFYYKLGNIENAANKRDI